MPDVIADRRDAPRYPLTLAAEVIELASGIKALARTSDVSRTGCYIDTLNPSPKGAQILIRLIHGGEIFETQATVMYVSPGLGMGVRFREQVTQDQLTLLDRWLGEAARSL
jgi:hypothetical protein